MKNTKNKCRKWLNEFESSRISEPVKAEAA